VPDDLTNDAAGLAAPDAPRSLGEPAPVPLNGAPSPDAFGPARRPSWLRALLISVAVLAAGAALGAGAYHYERSASIQPPAVEKTGDGWVVTAHHQREFSGIALSGEGLFWQNGAAIEYLELDTGRLRLLGPGPGMRTTWDPAAGERYVIWFEAERQETFAAQAVVYDTETGRRRTFAEVGSVRSYPSLSGDVAVWCSALAIGAPSINGARIGSDTPFEVAPEDGAPVISGSLVVWATSWTGPFVAAELASGTTWPVTASLSGGRLTGLALAGRTLVWGQSSEADGSGVVSTVDVDGGGTTVLAKGVTGLSGPAFDGRTVVWSERTPDGARVMAHRLGGGAYEVAAADGGVKEVAVSGDTVAWIAATTATQYEIVVTRLSR
jgi:hypothetical protein